LLDVAAFPGVPVSGECDDDYGGEQQNQHGHDKFAPCRPVRSGCRGVFRR
jgi:hypothetical protein